MPMNAVSHFAQSYAEARDKFLAAGAERGARMFRDVHPSERGAQGEELSIDLAQIGDHKAPALLLLSSGTHGVEGFCGSGCQIALMGNHDYAATGSVNPARFGEPDSPAVRSIELARERLRGRMWTGCGRASRRRAVTTCSAGMGARAMRCTSTSDRRT